MKRRPSCYCLLLLAILILASSLRFYRLDAQSFWNDEGNSARIAERPLDLILAGAEGDIHPPGYYLLLHYWRMAFGQSEFALRSLSVAAGLILVAFTYLLGRRLFNRTTALTGAFLSATAPLAIYYSQEARMYALLGLLSAISTYLLLRTLTSDPSPASCLLPPASYILTCAAGLYVHYAFPFILVVHNAIFGLWWLTRARRRQWLVLWAGIQAAIVVLYLPWLPTALNSVTGWSSAGQAYQLGPALIDVLRVLTVGITLPVEEATAPLIGAAFFLLAGLWPIRGPAAGARQTDQTDWFGAVSLILYLLLPIGLFFALDLYKETWLKFLVVVLPPFHLLIAHGIEISIQFATRLLPPASRLLPPASCLLPPASRLLPPASCLLPPASCLLPPASRLLPPASRLLPPASCFLLPASCLLLLAPSLSNLYFNPAYFRDDYRQIAADVAAAARPGDAVILNAPNQWEVFTYYYPDRDVYPAPYRPTPDEMEAFMTPLIERYQRLFVLYWGDAESDPQRLLETLLAARAYKAGDRWYGRVRLAIYGVASLPEERIVALDARFGEFIHLSGYALADARFAPGDVLPVILLWKTRAPTPERYKVTVQLLTGNGQLGAQSDTEPGDGLAPTTTWQPGQTITDRYGILVPPDLPPGRYTAVVAMYPLGGGARLPVALDDRPVGDALPLGDVEVTRQR